MLLTNIKQYLQTTTYEDQSSRNNGIVKMCPVDSKLTDVSEVLAASVIAFMIVKKNQSRYTPWRRLGGEEV
jgi:hypothetical protein